jgi:hypothetical protein
MSADYIQAVPTIDFTDAELAAVTAVIRGTIEDDKFPHSPRTRSYAYSDGEVGRGSHADGRERGDGEGDRTEANPAPEGPAASQSRRAGAAITKGLAGDPGLSAALSHSPEVPRRVPPVRFTLKC